MAVSKNEEKIAEQHKNQWFGFIKSIATFRGDLASITAPPFLLSPQSMVEFSAYWAEHPSIFIAPAKESEPEKRALLVLRWFLSTLKQQHNSKDESGKRKKMKPLNPFLGELFLGKWEDDAGITNLVTEQVSHHPPATAFNLWNEEHGIRLRGHVAPNVYFSGTVHIDRKGYSILHIDKYNEDYLINMPKIHVEGLMTGSLAPELSGSSYIRSSSGYTAKIDYTSKGWLGGKRNGFIANLFHDSDKKKSLYTLEGQWSDSWTCKNNGALNSTERFDTNALPRTPLQVAPLSEQHPLESRRAWQYVSQAIHKGDVFAVSYEKSKIENEQRAMRAREKREEAEFSRRYFSKANEDITADKLATEIPGTSLKAEMCGNEGIWLWDEDKYKTIQAERLGSHGVKSPTRMRFDSGIGGILLDPTEA
ncbi:hypothetical protein B0O99DRAFT_683262 [Bisporella sp. PMI_857]|nr:hypothetical protein B0O99DRAFT_683262 [Bisporella sp. PMI_857]